MKKICTLFIVLLAIVTLNTCAFAEISKDIITGKQDFIVMGSVKDIKDGTATVTIDRVLQHDDSELVGTDIAIEDFKYSYCINHAPSGFNDPVISDNVVVSLDYTDDKYVVKNGAFKVDSIEYSSCKVLKYVDETNDECIRSLAEITCFIRSEGRVKEFTFDRSGSIYAVYPQTMEECIVSVDDEGKHLGDEVVTTVDDTVNPTAKSQNENNEADYKWIYAVSVFVIGAFIGLLVALWLAKKKAKNLSN